MRRPRGQLKPPNAEVPSFGPCKRLDFELEMGVVVGQPSPIGEMLTEAQAEEMIFGFVILNDWSARDIQQWEYVPLGPFQAKAFATSISPWVVTREALEPFRVQGPAQDPAPLPYLRQARPNNYDLELDVALRAAAMNEALRICRTNFKYMYWSSVQQLVHHASSGCAMNIGDLLGCGTISGPEKNQRGSLLEISWNGSEPVELAGGAGARSSRTAICWSCAAGARATAIASVLARSRGRSCRRDDAVIAGSEARSNPDSTASRLDCFSELITRVDDDGCAEYTSPLLRRNIPDPRRMRGDVLEAVLEVHALVRRRLFAAHAPGRHSCAGLIGRARIRRRSSGRRCEFVSTHPRRTCIHSCRSALPLRWAAGPCRNIRSSVGVAAPWSSHASDESNHRKSRAKPNDEFPSIWDSTKRTRFSGSFALSFSRSSTIDERTWATLWCGISTLLTMSDRLLRSRSTAFSR